MRWRKESFKEIPPANAAGIRLLDGRRTSTCRTALQLSIAVWYICPAVSVRTAIKDDKATARPVSVSEDIELVPARRPKNTVRSRTNCSVISGLQRNRAGIFSSRWFANGQVRILHRSTPQIFAYRPELLPAIPSGKSTCRSVPALRQQKTAFAVRGKSKKTLPGDPNLFLG